MTRRLIPRESLRIHSAVGLAGTMPMQKGLGPDDREHLQDRRKPTIQLDQKQAIAVRELDAISHLPPQHGQLTPERGVLHLKWLFG